MRVHAGSDPDEDPLTPRGQRRQARDLGRAVEGGPNTSSRATDIEFLTSVSTVFPMAGYQMKFNRTLETIEA
jgi:hypothetical protein